MQGSRYLEDSNQGSILCSSLPFLTLSSFFPLVRLLLSILSMNMSFPMLVSVETDAKLLSFLEALYPFLKHVFFCRLLWGF
jgi:hypothetical protein